MKRVMLDVPDMTTLISITYIYNDDTTYDLMAGTSIITNSDYPSVMNGMEPYNVRDTERRRANETPH